MSYRNFLDEIKKGFPQPVYLLVSSDPFLHTEAEIMFKKLVDPGQIDFNFHLFDLMSDNKIPFEQIIDVLNTVPFFSGRKFVIIENFQKILKRDIVYLQAYIRKPSESSVLVLLHVGSLKKEVKDGLSGLKQISLDIVEKDIPVWLRERARLNGYELTDSAVDCLLDMVGPDIGLLSTELEKFVLIGKIKIDRKDIEDIVESKRTYNAFALVDAIRSKNLEKAFKIYSVLRETDDDYSLLGALNWQYSRACQDKSGKAEIESVFNIFSLLHKADAGIRTSGGSYPLELLLVNLLKKG